MILKSGGTCIAGAVDVAVVMGVSDKGCLDFVELKHSFAIWCNTTGCQNVAGLGE